MIQLNGVLIKEADKPNKNGIIFPKACLERIVEELQDKSLRGFPSSMSNPKGKEPRELPDDSHLFFNFRMEGNNLIADGFILDTELGIEAQKIISSGFETYYGFNGFGELDGRVVKPETFRLDAIDFVVK
jgi:hypothetical protein